MKDLIVIANDMRSTHNVGSLFRTAEGLGVKKLYLTGYTPHPKTTDDTRLPHIIEKLESQIDKTALDSTSMIDWEYSEGLQPVLEELRTEGYTIAALEQTKTSIELHSYKPPQKLALLLGTEVTGIPKELLDLCDVHLEIPMFGKKESFNVVQAAAMALHHLRFS